MVAVVVVTGKEGVIVKVVVDISKRLIVTVQYLKDVADVICLVVHMYYSAILLTLFSFSFNLFTDICVELYIIFIILCNLSKLVAMSLKLEMPAAEVVKD